MVEDEDWRSEGRTVWRPSWSPGILPDAAVVVLADALIFALIPGVVGILVADRGIVPAHAVQLLLAAPARQ